MGVDRARRDMCLGDERFAWEGAHSLVTELLSHGMVLSVQAGYYFGGTGVWTGTGCPYEFSRATEQAWDETSRIRDGHEGVHHHTICRVGDDTFFTSSPTSYVL